MGETARRNRHRLWMTVAALLQMCMFSCKLADTATPSEWEGKVATVYAPSDEEDLSVPAVRYPRIIELQHSGNDNGTLLVTMEECTKTSLTHGYPIFRSRDGGRTWEYVTKVQEDTELPPRWQVHLFELPRQLGAMPAGTILLAACSINNSIPKSALRVYRSYDAGETWELCSTVVTGGASLGTSHLSTGVWEPFLMMLDDGRLVCYYSDSTDAVNHSQELSYRLSSDGVNWGPTVKICSFPNQADRPGMSVIARLKDGRYMMVYEYMRENSAMGNLPVSFKYSNDGLDWGDPADLGRQIRSSRNASLHSGPYIAYIPSVGGRGRIIVRGTYQSPAAPAGVGAYLFYNDNYGEGAWEERANPTPYSTATVHGQHGYSSGMCLSADGKALHLVCMVDNFDSDKNYSRIVYARLEEEAGW